MSSEQTLSVCLIVKNEAGHLAECLASVEAVAHEIIVVDTGSTDETVKIAEAAGARIKHFEWCQDFAAARNVSIADANCDWILWLDADERLLPESISQLKKCLITTQRPTIYRVHIRNLREDGKSYTLSDAHRLFTNRHGIQFSGAIHEQVSPSLAKLGGEERDSRIELLHYGYGLTGTELTAKLERNRPLLLNAVEQDRNNAYSHFTLAHNYKQAGEVELAVKHYERALELNQFEPGMRAALLNTLSDALMESGQTSRVPTLIAESIKLAPRQISAYYLQFKREQSRGDSDAALHALLSMAAKAEMVAARGSQISTDIGMDSAIIDKSIGELQIQIIDKCLEEGRISETIERVEAWEQSREVSIPVLERKAVALLRSEDYEYAARTYTKLLERNPENGDRWIKRIAGIYAKMGETERAIEILSASKSA